MPVSVYQNTFAKLSGNGAQIITGVGFRPKAIIFWGASMTGSSILDGMAAFYGFADGTNMGCISCAAEDNIATSDTLSGHDTRWCVIPYNTNADAVLGAAVLTSFNSDGFTLTWESSDASTGTIHYMAIGGDDITNVKVGIQTIGTAATGLKAYTGVGFQPDFLLTANNGFISASPIVDLASTVDHAGLGISAMKSPTERWSTMNVIEGGRVDSDSWRYQRNDKCFSLLNNTTGTVTGEADFLSFNSDGFTWNYSTTGTNITNSKFIYLAIKGGVWDVGSQSVGVTGNLITTTNTNPSALLKGIGLAFVGLVAGNNIPNNTSIGSIGGTDGIRQSCIGISDLDAAATMANVRIQQTSNINYGLVANATAASSTVFATASILPFRESSFNINWPLGDASAYLFCYFALSEKIQPHSFGKINTMMDNNLGGAIFG